MDTRGSWHADRFDDLTPCGLEGPAGAPMTLTLGRTPLRRFGEFTFVALPKIACDAARAPGLILAGGAGSPLTGSVTFTIWRDPSARRRFAYDAAGAHGETIQRDSRRGLLSEQLVLRLEPTHLDGAWAHSRDRDALEALARLIPG